MQPDTPSTAQQYVDAFRELGALTDTRLRMLRFHYDAFKQTITATELAEHMGFSRYSVANAQYGKLGRLVGECLEYNPMPERLGTLVTFEYCSSEWHWLLRPQVAAALEQLGWVNPAK